MKKRIIFLWIVLLFTLLGVAVLITQLFYWQDASLLHVYMLDVGQGDALIIETPQKMKLLIDGGPDSQVLQRIHEVTPLFDATIQVVIASHADADHITGLVPLLSLFEQAKIVIASSSQSMKFDDVTNAFREAYQAKASEVTTVQAGDRLYLDNSEDIFIEFLHPASNYSDADINNHSLVFKLVHKDVCMIFTGDASVENEKTILGMYTSDFLRCDVLKIGHHGSDTSTSALFAGTVQPTIALLSAGKENKYGHPHQSVLNILETVGAHVFRTDEQGTVHVVSDGSKVWVEN